MNKITIIPYSEINMMTGKYTKNI